MEINVTSFLKMRLTRTSASDHIRVQFFFGPDEDHYELSGELRVTDAEWRIFSRVLAAGIKASVRTETDENGVIVSYSIPLRATIVGEMQALGCEDELFGSPDILKIPPEETDASQGDVQK